MTEDPNLDYITIAHVSDVHFSEKFWDDPNDDPKIPGRWGHDIQAFVALTNALETISWNFLVVSGDVSRVGSKNSFVFFRQWLESGIAGPGDLNYGLNLENSKSHWIVVPGNHDRFNEEHIQSRLDNYLTFLPPVVPSKPLEFRTTQGVRINFHLYDSSWEDGGFALGRLEPHDMLPKTLNSDDIDVAVMHHHLIQPVGHPREKWSEVVNSAEAIAYFLNCKFDALLFGHTHKEYIDKLPSELVAKLVPDRRKCRRLLSKLLPLVLVNNLIGGSGLGNYKKIRTKDGQHPKTSKYLEYLHVKKVLKKNVKGPSEFESVSQFYQHLDQFGSNFDDLVEDRKVHSLAISMSPSGCQIEASRKGFNVIKFGIDKGTHVTTELFSYLFDGVKFQPK